MAKPTSTRGRRRIAQADPQPSNIVQFAKPKLVPRAGCFDTAELLGDLGYELGKGELLGIAVVAFYKQRRYSIAITDEAARSPTFTLGALMMLQADIAKKIELFADDC